MKARLSILLSALLMLSILLPSNLLSEDYEIEKIKKKLPKMLGANNVGKEFWVTIPPCYEVGGTDNFIKVFVTSPSKTIVNIDIPGKGFHTQKPSVPNDVIEFNIAPAVGQAYQYQPGDPVPAEKVYRGFGMNIHAEQSIVVYVVVRYRATSDGYLAIPASSLGRQYIVASYGDMGAMYNGRYPSECGIVGVYDKTQVTFTLGGNAMTRTGGGMKYNQITAKQLDKGDVWMFSSDKDEGDLTGSKIVATKPVALVSGNFCTNIPTTNRWCDYTVEMDLPMYTWGFNYHVAKVPGRLRAPLIRVFAKEPKTQLFRDGKAIGNIPASGGVLNFGYLEMRLVPFDAIPRSAVISGDKPIGVTMYNTGVEEDGYPLPNSDPFIMAQTPMEQYQTEITFCTPGIYGGQGFPENYLNLVYETNEFGFMDNTVEFAEVSAGQFQWTPVKTRFSSVDELFNYDIDGKKYAVKTITLPKDGVYKIRAERPFAAYSFGYSWCDSYGYPTSAALIDIEKPDTVAPDVTWEIDCAGNVYNGVVNDMPDADSIRVNLSIIEMLSSESYNYYFEYEDFEAGTDRKTEFSLEVIDKTEDARAVIIFTDRNGNETTKIIEYRATKITIRADHDYGLLEPGTSAVWDFWAINESEDSPAKIDTIRLKTNDPAFNLNDQGFELIGLNLPMTIPPKDSVKFQCRFNATDVGKYLDSIGIGDTCVFAYETEVQAKVGSAVINVGDYNFQTHRVGANVTAQFAITNSSPTDVELRVSDYDGNYLSVYTTSVGDLNISQTNELVIPKDGFKIVDVNFRPDKTGYFRDSIVFHSNAGEVEDNVAILEGYAVEPKFVPNSYTWDRMRIDRAKFPAGPYDTRQDLIQDPAIKFVNLGSEDVTIDNATIEVISGDQSAFVDKNGVPISSGTFKNKVVPKEDSSMVEIFFQPKTVGVHEVKITYETIAGNDKFSVLKGTGVVPRVTIETPLDFGTTQVNDQVNMGQHTCTFRNLNLTDDGYEWYDTLNITEFLAGPNLSDIGMSLANKSASQGFAVDMDQHSFPMKLNPGEEIVFNAEFIAQHNGDAAATLSSNTDAEAEVTSDWSGFGITEGIDQTGGSTTICMGEEDIITCRITNTGTAALTNIKPEFEDIYPELTLADPANDAQFDLPNTDDYHDVEVRFAPTGPVQINTYLVFTNETQTKIESKAPVNCTATHYDRTTSLSPVSQERLVGDKAKMTLSLDNGDDISMANLQEVEVTMTYDNDFLEITKENIVPAAGLTLTEITGVEMIQHSKGLVQFRLKTTDANSFINNGTPLCDAVFKLYFPSGTDRTANVNIEVTRIGTQCVDISESNASITLAPVCVDNIRHIAKIQGTYYLNEVNPNPVSSAGANIEFGVALEGWTTIGIFDELGNMAAMPISDVMKPGEYSFPLPIQDLSSGVYTIRMLSGSHIVKTQKLVISK